MTQRITFFAITACTLFLVACNKRSDVANAPQATAPSSNSTTNVEPAEVVAAPQAPKLTLGGVEPAKDDVLLRYYVDDPDTLNLITSSDNVSSEFQRQVYDGLATREYSDPSRWELHLAKSWEFDEDNLEYIIHLRKGVKWHPITLPNGQVIRDKEFTANDVTFTFACVLNRHVEAASLRSYYSTVNPDSGEETPRIIVTKIDDYTVSVKWTEPYFMADEFTLGAGIMPRHVYSVDKNGEPISFDFGSKEFADGFNNHWANTTMCGTGPMIFKEWKKGEQVVLERNPDYYGAPNYFSKIVFQFISNPNTARQKVLQNDLDLAGYSEADHFIEDQDHPNVKAGKVKLENFRRTAYRYMGYNLRRPVFEDKNVRTALSYAVPVDDIIQQIYHGLAVRSTGPFLPGGLFCNNDIQPIPFDLDKSRQLLDEAGWKDTNENGVRDKMIDGKLIEFNFDLMIYADSPQYLSIAEIIKANCRKVGVDVQISPSKWALMLQKLRKKEFDATILGWVSDWKGDPYQIWHGSQADLPESSNSGGYKNPEVDKLIDQLRITMNEQDQIKIYHELHRLIFEDQPYTFLYLDNGMMGVDSRVQNLKFYSLLRPHMDAREWYSSSPRLFGK
jgi:peptide/nickel transport system substrate-binding protein